MTKTQTNTKSFAYLYQEQNAKDQQKPSKETNFGVLVTIPGSTYKNQHPDLYNDQEAYGLSEKNDGFDNEQNKNNSPSLGGYLSIFGMQQNTGIIQVEKYAIWSNSDNPNKELQEELTNRKNNQLKQ